MSGRLLLKAVSALLIGAIFSPSASAQETLPSEPINAIGQIICVSGHRSMTTTATVIEDRNSLLAVSHFNYDHRSRSSISEANCVFVLRSERGRILFRSSFEVVSRGARGADISFSRATDWAVLKLTTPVPEMVRPVTVAFDHDTSRASAVTLKGLRGHSGEMVERSDCRPIARGPGSAILDHNCRTSPGLSGAPLIASTSDGPRLVAIHAARDGGMGLAVLIKGYAARSISDREKGNS